MPSRSKAADFITSILSLSPEPPELSSLHLSTCLNNFFLYGTHLCVSLTSQTWPFQAQLYMISLNDSKLQTKIFKSKLQKLGRQNLIGSSWVRCLQLSQSAVSYVCLWGRGMRGRCHVPWCSLSKNCGRREEVEE